MARRKKIPYGQPGEVTFTLRERVLICEHTFAGPDLTGAIEAAESRGKNLIARCSLDDLDELLGHVAAEANHTNDRKLAKELYALFDRLKTEMESYDDGQWQSDF